MQAGSSNPDNNPIKLDDNHIQNNTETIETDLNNEQAKNITTRSGRVVKTPSYLQDYVQN